MVSLIKKFIISVFVVWLLIIGVVLLGNKNKINIYKKIKDFVKEWKK